LENGWGLFDIEDYFYKDIEIVAYHNDDFPSGGKYLTTQEFYNRLNSLNLPSNAYIKVA